jgi:hypothetical protein
VLVDSLLSLQEISTASRWECPYYRVPFDMSHIGWVMTANRLDGLPDPFLSRCPPLNLSTLGMRDLIGFAERESARRGLSCAALGGIIDALYRMEDRVERLSLRVVLRMLDLAERLEERQLLN